MQIQFDSSYYDDPKNVLLVISRDEFIQRIQDRIKVGESLFGVFVRTPNDLSHVVTEYNSWTVFNDNLLRVTFNIPNNEYWQRYKSAQVKISTPSPTISGRHTEIKRLINIKVNALKQIRQLSELIPSKKDHFNKPALSMSERKIDISKVFVVHGHDEVSQLKVARTLDKLNLIPIILHEQASSGRTVIEKFEYNSNVGFAVIILSADDLGKSKLENDLKARARQNVILELGYFIGKLGRNRVMALYEDGVELPSDLSGLVYVSLDKGGSWRLELVKELQAANYNVDANSLTK